MGPIPPCFGDMPLRKFPDKDLEAKQAQSQMKKMVGDRQQFDADAYLEMQRQGPQVIKPVAIQTDVNQWNKCVPCEYRDFCIKVTDLSHKEWFYKHMAEVGINTF